MAEKSSVLRYPYDLYTAETDYLQITLLRQKIASTALEAFDSNSLIRSPGSYKANKNGNDVSKTLRPNAKVASVGDIILLPIPSNIADSNSVNFSEDKLDAITARVAGAAYNIMNTKFPDNGGVEAFLRDLGKNTMDELKKTFAGGDTLRQVYLTKLAAEAAGLAGIGNISLDQILARSQGKILNPNMELLFNGPTIRSFKFSFKFTPRNEKEGEQVKLIISSFKRHMAPVPAGDFLGTPGQFELRYRTGAGDHKFLNKIKKCVLKDMSVNYTGENVYATYADGTPVSMIMDLTFQELEPIYSTDYDENAAEGVGY
jgi:hypothetical protein